MLSTCFLLLLLPHPLFISGLCSFFLSFFLFIFCVVSSCLLFYCLSRKSLLFPIFIRYSFCFLFVCIVTYNFRINLNINFFFFFLSFFFSFFFSAKFSSFYCSYHLFFSLFIILFFFIYLFSPLFCVCVFFFVTVPVFFLRWGEGGYRVPSFLFN